MGLILGVDGGNTKTVALIAADDGTILGAGRSGCSDIYGASSAEAAIEALAQAVEGAVQQAGRQRTEIAVGCFSLAGADWPDDYAFLTAQIRGRRLARTFEVYNDALGSLRSGVIDGVGVVIACGTGIAIAARSRSGQFWHGSFWLENLGGNQIGHDAVRAITRAELGIDPPTSLTARVLAAFNKSSVEAVIRLFTTHGVPPPTMGEVARLAPLVLQAAAEGDAASQSIVRHHAHRMMDYALAAARQVELDRAPFSLVLNGGIFRDAGGTLIAALQDEIARRGDEITLIRARYEPAVGALLHAFEHGGYPLDAPRLERLEASLPPPELFFTHA